MKKLHEKKTLMGMKKEQLVEHIMRLEHNAVVMEQTFETQYSNCVKMIADMNLLNDTLSKAHTLADDTIKQAQEAQQTHETQEEKQK